MWFFLKMILMVCIKRFKNNNGKKEDYLDYFKNEREPFNERILNK